jgi:hypothetical protein
MRYRDVSNFPRPLRRAGKQHGCVKLLGFMDCVFHAVEIELVAMKPYAGEGR